MTATEILFWFLSALALFSALMVLVSKNPVHSVLWLIVVFFSISGHYILLNAQFLIMLMNLNTETEPQKNLLLKLAGVVAGCLLLTVMVSAVRSAGEIKSSQALMNEGDIGLIQNLGKALFTQYVVPFELSSILFLSAMVGAVVIGKKE